MIIARLCSCFRRLEKWLDMRNRVVCARSVWRKRGLRLLICSIGLPLTAGFAGTAAAQDGDVARKIRVGISAASVYDDNVFRVPDETPPSAVTTRDDFRFTPSVDVDVIQPVGRQSLFLSGAMGYDFYRNNKQLESERINLEGGGNLRFGSGCSSRVALSFGRQQSNLADFGRVIGVPNVEKSLGAGGRFSCGTGLGIQPSLTYDFEKVANGNARLVDNGYRATTIGATIGYARPSLGEVGVYASYRNGIYPNRFLPSGVTDGVRVYSGGVNFKREIGTQLKGSASLGYTVVNPKEPFVRNFKGASWSADLDWVPNDRIQVGIGLGREVQQSNLLDISYSVNQNMGINASYALNRQMQLTFNASRDKRRIQASRLLIGNLGLTGDKTSTLGAGFRFQPQGRIGFSFDLRGVKRESAFRQFNYDNVTASLSVRYGI
jgi:Putative beta-barrel porin 2